MSTLVAIEPAPPPVATYYPPVFRALLAPAAIDDALPTLAACTAG